MKYKNTSNQTQELIGFGVVRPDEMIETQDIINNPNFELVEETKRKEDKK